MDTNTKANHDFIKARAMELTEQARRASLYPEMLIALKLALAALSPNGHFQYLANRKDALGDAYLALKRVITKCEKERIQ